MKTTVCGNYPKIDYKKSKINLRQAIHKFETNQISQDVFNHVVAETFKRTISDQLECGINFPTDGQITWTDLVSPYCNALDNVKPGGLRRLFDNNVYYRRPQITGEMKRVKKIVCEDLKLVTSFCSSPVKAVLCGPITFASFSNDFHYGSFEEVVRAISGIIREEVVDIEKLGLEYIQLDEPALPKMPEYLELFSEALKTIFSGIETKCGVAFYFTPLDKILDRLGKLPVDFIAIDFFSHPGILDGLPMLEEQELHAGLIDARNVKLEDKSNVLSKINAIKKAAKPSNILLTTSCGLEFLPRNYALNKMKLLSEIAREAN